MQDDVWLGEQYSFGFLLLLLLLLQCFLNPLMRFSGSLVPLIFRSFCGAVVGRKRTRSKGYSVASRVTGLRAKKNDEVDKGKVRKSMTDAPCSLLKICAITSAGMLTF